MQVCVQATWEAWYKSATLCGALHKSWWGWFWGGGCWFFDRWAVVSTLDELDGQACKKTCSQNAA